MIVRRVTAAIMAGLAMTAGIAFGGYHPSLQKRQRNQRHVIMIRCGFLGLSLVIASTLVGSAWATAAGASTSHPVGRYSGSQSAGGGVWLYVDATKTQVQDLVVTGIAVNCTGGGHYSEAPIVIDALSIQVDNSFSSNQTGNGYVNNNSAHMTATLEGVFGATGGTQTASGTYVETATFTLNGNLVSCTSGTQTWSMTRDTQPKQPAGVGAAGTYAITLPLGGDAASFQVSTSRSEMKKLNFSKLLMVCRPNNGNDVVQQIDMKSLALPSSGSLSAKVKGTYAPPTQTPTNYTFTFKGHFHGKDSTGASRAAGSYVMKGSTTVNGVAQHCTSDKQWWSASLMS